MVNDHSESERGILLLSCYGLIFPNRSIYDRVIPIMAFVESAVEHGLEREIGQWVHHERSI